MNNKKVILGEDGNGTSSPHKDSKRSGLILLAQGLRTRVQEMPPEKKEDILARIPKHLRK